MLDRKNDFCEAIRAKDEPNEHEQQLSRRAQKYIASIARTPGIKMIAVCNSLSMNATNDDSDIDLFIVTHPKMLWFVRIFVTFTLARAGVWRRGADIAGNFCLSFFITENALNLSPIAIDNDIYLYFWVYFLRPIVSFDDTYERFLAANSWVTVDDEQKQKNQKYLITSGISRPIHWWQVMLNGIVRVFGEAKTQYRFRKMKKPVGVIINRNILKFHDHDQRERVRDAIQKGNKFSKNF